MKRCLPVLAMHLACSGETQLPPHGEALFVVDTDVPVPQLAGRLRVDVFDERGAWIESRDIGRSDPRTFPASFSVYSNDDARAKRVLVRLRVYPEGVVRDYRGERFEPRATFSEPVAAKTTAELCAAPPELPLGGRVTLRRGGAAITTTLADGKCGGNDRVGSVAARVTIARTGTYRFSIANAAPYIAESVLTLRTRCDDPTSQLACNMQPGVNVTSPGHFPRFDAKLEPGTYFLVTSGTVPDWPADLTLESLSLDDPPLETVPAPATATAAGPPRLFRPGRDVDETPTREPLPNVTIDRLVLVTLEPGKRGAVRVTMRGACAGTMAMLGEEPRIPSLSGARTCVDQPDQLEHVVEMKLDADLERRDPSVQGSFGSAATCDGVVVADPERVCIPGGAFVFGSRSLGPEPGTMLDTTPERVAVMPRFFIDRHEVTVRRMREAIARGLAVEPGTLVETSGAPDPRRLPCSFSRTGSELDDYGVSCIGWRLARAFCRFSGGDLPTEAQWEYAALAAGRPFKTTQPWGDEEPDCLRAVVARARGSGRAVERACVDQGLPPGPAPVTSGDRRDVTPQGVVGFAGGLAEWTLDSAASLASACWRAAPLSSPRCWEEDAPQRIARGGAWTSDRNAVSRRFALPGAIGGAGFGAFSPATPDVGFRCVYEDGQP